MNTIPLLARLMGSAFLATIRLSSRSWPLLPWIIMHSVMAGLLGTYLALPHFILSEILNMKYSPGRFFAVAELKMMLGYVLTTYDFKLAEGCHHKMQWLESKVIPDKSIKMTFKKRKLV